MLNLINEEGGTARTGLQIIVRLNFLSFAAITILFCVACSDLPPEEESQNTLPPPGIRVIQPTETEIFSETVNTTSEPPSQLESSSASENADQIDSSEMMIGTESHHLGLNGGEELLVGSGLQLVRHNALLWQKVEPNEGDREWDAVGELERKLINAAEFGLSTILIVRGTPSWAQKVPGAACGPVREDKLADFADFLSEAVSRYSSPPYNVKFWELGNEPDVDPSLVRPNSVFGCWGDNNDPYYGGGYYAEMLKVVYPAIKTADPEAKVLIGGLLLDCDPTYPPEGKDCKPGKYLEGILRNGGGEYFDIVSFHGYPPYASWPSGNGALYYDEHYPPWEHRGGVVIGKVDFLRQVMDAYEVDKPIIHTEGSLICPEANTIHCNPPGEDFFEAQADFVVRLYVRNWANGLLGSIWYQFEGPGWRSGGLLDGDQNPKPAYNALKFLSGELNEAKFNRQLEEFDQVSGYEFIKDEKPIWILWSTDEIPHIISLDQNPNIIFDKYGNHLDLSPNSKVQVMSPIYLEFNP